MLRASAIVRADVGDPSASRYVYVGAVFLLVLAAELSPPIESRLVVAVAMSLAILAVWGNAATFRRYAAWLRETSEVVAAELAVVERHGTEANATVAPDVVRAPVITVGPYLAAVDHLGSPAIPLAALAHASPAAREEADRVALLLTAPKYEAGQPSALAARPRITSGGVVPLGPPGCVQSAPGATVVAELPDEGLFVTTASASPPSVAFQRFGDHPILVPSGTLDPARPVVLLPRADSVSLPWRVTMTSSSPMTICAAAT